MEISTIQSLLERLFPVCRSITGNGVRRTLEILREIVDFNITEIPSGTTCFDWKVPDEWNITDAYLEDEEGNRYADFKFNNLHVVSYSEPVNKWLEFKELEPHLHSLPEMPEAIPYRTSYYKRDWGFCLTHRSLAEIDRSKRFHAVIESDLKPGSMTYGDIVLSGKSDQEYLISTYCCHPSMGNDNLSGVVLWAALLHEIQSLDLYHSYRFVIIPETIGAICYLSEHSEAMKKISGCLLPSNVAGPGRLGYKKTFIGDHTIDRIVEQTFLENGIEPVIYPFDILGSDERQYSSPGFRIPTGTICKDKYYEFQQYHTSLDNLEFANAGQLYETLQIYLGTIHNLEMNRNYLSRNPNGEPMLGKRGLYKSIGGSLVQPAHLGNKSHRDFKYKITTQKLTAGSDLDAMRWLLFYADGSKSLLDIAELINLPMSQLFGAARTLEEHGLIEEIQTGE